MSVYAGKFVDRSPLICAAGKVIKDTENVKTCMRDYPVEDKVNALKHDANIFEEKRPTFKQPPFVNHNQIGIYTESHPVLIPPQQTSYQKFLNELKESANESTWNKIVGKTRDPFKGNPSGLPHKMDPVESITFGDPTITLATVQELINPKKSPQTVICESEIGHDLYQKSHNDYHPGEQVKREYKSPPFDPERRYGRRTKYDPRGMGTKCASIWCNTKPVAPVSTIQAEVRERMQYQLGKCFEPCKNRKSVPRSFTYGKPCKRELYGMEELLKDADRPPCVFKRSFQDWMEHLNQIRVNVKNRSNKFGFDLRDFRNRIAFYDKEATGWTSLEFLYKMCQCYHINFDHSLFEPLMELAGVLRNGYIHYDSFIDLININQSVLEIVKINDIPKKNQYYETTYQAMNCEFLQCDNSQLPPAGIPSIRFDQPELHVKEGQCKADLDNLGDEMSAGALVNPSVFTTYGLSHRDLLEPIKPAKMKTLFENVGYQFPEDTFEKIWQKGVEEDKTGLVCIDTFRRLLKQCTPPPKLIEENPEKECFVKNADEKKTS